MIRLSPSQIKSFDGTKGGCQRLWAYNKIAGIPSVGGVGARLGTEIHAQIETLLRGGSLDFSRESGYMISAGIEHIPAPGTPGMHIEREFFFDGENATYNGRIDCELVGEGVVIDWKSTSSFNWQKSEQELRQDPQAVLYACHFFIHNPEAETVTCRWVYFRTRGGHASQVTELTFTQQEALDGLCAIEKTAAQMAFVAAAAPKDPAEIQKYILSLPPTESSCGNYGGCQHRGRCSDLSPLNGLKAYLAKEKTMSLLKKASPGAGTATPGAVAVVPAQINPPEQHLPPKVTDPAGMAAQAAAQAPTPVPSGTAPTGRGLMARVKANLCQVANPAVTQAAVAVQALTSVVGDAVAQMAPVESAVVPELGQHTAAEARAVAAGKKRGRPAGSKNRVAEAPILKESIGAPMSSGGNTAVAKCREDRITEALEALVEEVRSLRTILEGRP